MRQELRNRTKKSSGTGSVRAAMTIVGLVDGHLEREHRHPLLIGGTPGFPSPQSVAI